MVKSINPVIIIVTSELAPARPTSKNPNNTEKKCIALKYFFHKIKLPLVTRKYFLLTKYDTKQLPRV